MSERWIDCRKILPELGVPVLVWCWKIKDVEIASLDSSGLWTIKGWPLTDVTHWMPKPDGPQDEGNTLGHYIMERISPN